MKKQIVNIERERFLFGQNTINSFVVDAISERLLCGDQVPELLIQRLPDGSIGIKDGAHRFMAYKRIGKNPNVLEPYLFHFLDYDVEILDLKIEGDLSGNRRRKLIEALSYFSDEDAKDFCFRKSLDSSIYLSQ